MNAEIGQHKAKILTGQSLDKRFHYFKQLTDLAKTLTAESSGLLDVAKEFQAKLKSTQAQLAQDFTPEEIDDQLGDIDFMNDFAEQLFEALNSLSNTCTYVINDCKARKARLTKALIWGEEELTELAASSEATLMSQFYQELATGCNRWYSKASQKFASDADDMKQTMTLIGKHKYVIMNYAQENFHSVKGNLFNIADSLIDVQRQIESVDTYFTGRTRYLEKRITADPWKYQLKYSTGITKRCESSHAGISAFSATIQKNSGEIAHKMAAVYKAFVTGAKKDLAAWDCE